MKRIKNYFVLMLCVLIMTGTAACGSSNNADNGADQSTTENDRNTSGEDDRIMNDATKGDGILDDAVDDVTDGVDKVTDDVTDGVDKAVDEATDGEDARDNKAVERSSSDKDMN